MRRFIVATLCGVVLVACTGNQKPKQNGGTQQQTADTVSVVINSTDTESETDGPDELSAISCQVLKFLKKSNVPDRWLDLIDDNLTPEDMRDYSCWRLELPTAETSHRTNERFWARPVDGLADKLWSCYFVRRDFGGYIVIVDACSNNREKNKVSVTNAGCYYIDGKISLTTDFHGTVYNALPKPGINDFYSNADKFPKEVRDCLSKLRLSYKFYINYYDNSISVTMDPYELGTIPEWGYDFKIDHLPEPIRGLAKKYDDLFPTVNYRFDGDNYIIDSKHKPFEEDLWYFEPEDNKFALTGNHPTQLYTNLNKDQYSEADLNGDGIKDLVINDREYDKFAVYFKDDKGVYTRQFIARRPDNDGGNLSAYATNDTLRVSASFESTKDYVFHYQDGDFYLLNYSQSMEWPDDGGREYYEIDYLKHSITNSNDSHDTTYFVPAYPLLRLSEVPLGWWTIADIYSGCDMIAVWRQIERRADDEKAEKLLKYSRNHVGYELKADDSHCTRTHIVQCYEMADDDSRKVVDIYKLMCETQPGVFNLDDIEMTEYTFSKGKLSKEKLSKDFKSYVKDGYEPVFEDEDGYGYEGHKIKFVKNGTEVVFAWNGKEFVKQ